MLNLTLNLLRFGASSGPVIPENALRDRAGEVIYDRNGEMILTRT